MRGKTRAFDLQQIIMQKTMSDTRYEPHIIVPPHDLRAGVSVHERDDKTATFSEVVQAAWNGATCKTARGSPQPHQESKMTLHVGVCPYCGHRPP